MVTTIKAGTPPTYAGTVLSCKVCKWEGELEERDFVLTCDSHAVFTCPCCGRSLRFPLEGTVHKDL